MRYPNELRTHRDRAGVTQWEVAKTVDIPLDRYGRLEKGKSEPSYAEGVRLAEYFRVVPSTLFPTKTAAA